MGLRHLCVGNPKHKEFWHRGRKGSLCPREITRERAQALLDEGVCLDGVRYGPCAKEWLLPDVPIEAAGRNGKAILVGWMVSTVFLRDSDVKSLALAGD